jgi:lipid-A-disaccharide synthase-like uncharacterized protein
MPFESVTPLLPGIFLLLGVAAQIAYGCAVALFALRGATPRLRGPLRAAALLGGCVALAAAWLRGDAVFMVGQAVVCIAYVARPYLGSGHG